MSIGKRFIAEPLGSIKKKKMDIQIEIAKYVLNESDVSLPEFAYDAMLSGLESESLSILASMTNLDNFFERKEYFEKSLNELGLKLPQKRDAAITLLKYYLSELINNPNDCYEIMMVIDNKIYKPVFHQETSTKKYIGEEIGLERMYTWYRELQDFGDGSRLLYYNELPKEEQKKMFMSNLVEEAANLLGSQTLEKKINTLHNKD